MTRILATYTHFLKAGKTGWSILSLAFGPGDQVL
jgi:hypothetical protein